MKLCNTFCNVNLVSILCTLQTLWPIIRISRHMLSSFKTLKIGHKACIMLRILLSINIAKEIAKFHLGQKSKNITTKQKSVNKSIFVCNILTCINNYI